MMMRTSKLLAGALVAVTFFCAAVAASRTKHTEQIEAGRQVFERECASCHGPGIGNPGNSYKPGTDALRVKYEGSVPMLLTERTDLTPEMVAYFVRNGISVMPPFRKTEINDQQLAALGVFLTRKTVRSAGK